MSLAAITSKALPVLQLNFLISVHFFNTGVHLAFFVTEVSDCEHACSWVTATPAGARLPPSVRTTAMVICGVSFFRLSSLIQSLFWLAMLRCKTHICSKNIGKGIVLTQPGPHLTYFPALNSASCECLECEVGGMWSKGSCGGGVLRGIDKITAVR